MFRGDRQYETGIFVPSVIEQMYMMCVCVNCMYILTKLPQFINGNLATSLLLTLSGNVMNTVKMLLFIERQRTWRPVYVWLVCYGVYIQTYTVHATNRSSYLWTRNLYTGCSINKRYRDQEICFRKQDSSAPGKTMLTIRWVFQVSVGESVDLCHYNYILHVPLEKFIFAMYLFSDRLVRGQHGTSSVSWPVCNLCLSFENIHVTKKCNLINVEFVTPKVTLNIIFHHDSHKISPYSLFSC